MVRFTDHVVGTFNNKTNHYSICSHSTLFWLALEPKESCATAEFER